MGTISGKAEAEGPDCQCRGAGTKSGRDRLSSERALRGQLPQLRLDDHGVIRTAHGKTVAPIVLVVWKDAWKVGSAHEAERLLDRWPDSLSAGFVYELTDDEIVLAQTMDEYEGFCARDLIVIPLDSVTGIYVLKEVEPVEGY